MYLMHAVGPFKTSSRSLDHYRYAANQANGVLKQTSNQKLFNGLEAT